jgi:hypothetical protein
VHYSNGGATTPDVATLQHSKKAKFLIFFFYLTFACYLLNAYLHSSSPRKSTVERKKKTEGFLIAMLWIQMLLVNQGAPLHMIASGLLKLHWSSSATGLHNSKRQQQVQGGNFCNTSSCVATRTHTFR